MIAQTAEAVTLGSAVVLPTPVAAGRLRIGVLGPVQVTVDGREVVLPQAKLRVLLASLAIQHGKVVSVESLIRDLWADWPPATALRALRVYVSQLRKFLSRCGLPEVGGGLYTQAPGYRLELGAATLDRTEFDHLCAQAQQAADAGDYDTACRAYRRALALSRGPALADVRLGSPLENSALWLDELRLTTLLRCVDLELHRGQNLSLVAELTRLAAEHPLNERLHSRLMIALYRSGRTADALAVYRTVRDQLIEQLGTEPGVELRGVHQAVLAGDQEAFNSPELWTL